jgi:N-glycosylase/DNA lyase
MIRSPTVFEDLVKTICTTNCAWSATVRMVSALVRELGTAAEGAPERHAFPPPATVADAGDAFFRDVARAGYRGPYLRAVADDVASGRVDLEALRDPALPDQEVTDRLLTIVGVGPYAMAHMMMLLGRYRRLILDSWTRPKYRGVSGRPRITDKGIERAFRRCRQFAGLAFWLTLTEDWLPAVGGSPAQERFRRWRWSRKDRMVPMPARVVGELTWFLSRVSEARARMSVPLGLRDRLFFFFATPSGKLRSCRFGRRPGYQ